MSAKSEAYKKDLGNQKFRANYAQIQWNSSKSGNRQETDAQNIGKNRQTEVKA